MATWPPQGAYGAQSGPFESTVGVRECANRVAESSRVESAVGGVLEPCH